MRLWKRAPGWYPKPDDASTLLWWNGQEFEGEPWTDETPSNESPSAPSPEGQPNPVGLGVAGLGAALAIIGSFVPVHSYASIPIAKNSFVAGGQWWVLIAAVALAVVVCYSVRGRTADAAAGGISIPSLVIIAGGIYGLSSTFQTLRFNAIAQAAFGQSTVKGSPAAGVYLVLAGGIIGLVGALVVTQPFPSAKSDAASPATVAAPAGVTGELERLADLHSKGLLTDEEFTSAKKAALGAQSEMIG